MGAIEMEASEKNTLNVMRTGNFKMSLTEKNSIKVRPKNNPDHLANDRDSMKKSTIFITLTNEK